MQATLWVERVILPEIHVVKKEPAVMQALFFDTKEKELLRNFFFKNAMNNKIFITFAIEILTFYNIYC